MRRPLIPLCLFLAVGAAWAQVEPPPIEATVDKPLSLIRNGDFTQELAWEWGRIGIRESGIGGHHTYFLGFG